MRDIEKVIQELSIGYTPQSEGVKGKIAKVYDQTFEPLVRRKDLEAFFTIFKRDIPVLKAWAFLGIYLILESWLHPDLVFEPVFEYCKSNINNFDKVMSKLLVDVLSQSPDSRVEDLLLNFADQTKKHQLYARRHIIKAFENFGQKTEIEHKEKVQKVFKKFLSETTGTSNQTSERILKDSIIETSDRLKAILLTKLNDINNKHFIGDILRAIIILKNQVPNWQEIVMDNVRKYQLNDTDLIIALTESELLDQKKLIQFINEAKEWQLEFVREFLNTHLDILDTWEEFREEFISFLRRTKPKENEEDLDHFIEKKKMIFSVIIDLNLKDMAEYCVENFINLENEELQKMALFIVIRFGNDKVWINLRKYMDKDKSTEEYVKKFWNQLERRDWKFYY
ncbi:MAG: hypothetical protein P8Y97_19830 [Candidatus Lokiarchaeota archaeon]